MVSLRRTSAAFLLGLALCSAQGAETLLPSATARAPRAEPGRPADLPTDGDLQKQGARIGAIHFNSRELFDTAAHDDDTALARLANRLHVDTRTTTIADQLLFRTGDPYQPGLLQESARLLRDTRYLRDASIRPVAYHDGVVDVEVTTQDVWTFTPSVSFGRSGGANSSGFEIEELNLLGTGTQLGLGFKSSVDRDSKYLHYRDRQLGSSWWDVAADYADNSDGSFRALALEHPFYALDARWAGGASLLDDQRVDSRYDLGGIVDRYAAHERRATIYFGGSTGLHDGWARRITGGFTFEDHAFDPAPGDEATRLLPADRRLAYPWIGAEWVQDDFRTTRNRDQIEQTEDYSLGWHANAQVGFSMTELGADRMAAIVSGSLTKGWTLGERQTVQFALDGGGRIEGGSLRGGLLQAESRYYFRQSPRRLLYVNLAVSAGTDLDPDRQVLLGGDSGLRGYPLRYQAGRGRWLFTAEQRLFSNWYPFQLFNVGAAVFYDMGATWGRDPLGQPSRGVLSDAGFGLRLGNSRSARGSVLHLDVAFPFDREPGLKGLQFLVQTRKSF